MPPSKSSFVTGCQQVLALGVVLAALAPAASVVSLDIVRQTPGQSGSTTAIQGDLAAYSRVAQQSSRVPTEVVDPSVDEFSLTAAANTKAGRKADTAGLAVQRTVSARGKVGALDAPPQALTSLPQAVTGYGAVGVTWAHDSEVPDDAISVEVRTKSDGTWSEWAELEYHDEHGPDPDTREGRRARPGTDPMLIGEVDQVQVRAAADKTLPADMRLAVIDPGETKQTAEQRPALDTSAMDGSPAALVAREGTGEGEDDGTGDGTGEEPTTDVPDGDLDLQAGVHTPQPKIFSRSQWGADERLRDKGSLRYFEVHAGFVHHTVNANDYTRAQVPALLRGIYAYHTQSRGWSDIGYNFLVDRFGRIWEGRYGGIDRPVVGAHTLNYNDYSFAMSAIGNYETARPSQAVLAAYGVLLAWKLSLHGVDASSTKQRVGSRDFQAINGHRDAASTACPGRNLYAKLPEIRKLAAEAQRGWSGRELQSNLAGSAHPDLIVRRASDGKAFIIPTGGLTGFGKGVATQVAAKAEATVSPDLTGDGIGDLVVRTANGKTSVRPGTSDGTFGAGIKQTGALAGYDLITAVGDVSGDGRNDLVARWPSTGRLDLFRGRGDGRFRAPIKLGTTWGDYTELIGSGDANGDGSADLLARDRNGSMWLYPGNGKGGFGSRAEVRGNWSAYGTITGIGDFNADGRDDLFARESGSKQGVVLPSRGDGSYGHPLGAVARVKGVGSVVGAADIAGDKFPDVVARNGRRIVVFANSGTIEVGKPIATGTDLSNVNLVFNAGDWDRDGHGDIINRNAKSGALFLRRGDGTGRFAKPVKLANGFGNVGLLAAVGDMTGDGFPDLMGQPKGGAVRIYPGKGLNGLAASYVAHRQIDAGRQIAVGRWDADGAPDTLFRKGNKLTLYRGNGPGGLTAPRQLSVNLAPYDWVVGISDATLGGHPDVIVREKTTGHLWLLQGAADGFKPRRFLAEGMGEYDLAG